jgi:hypothetical protein
MLLRASLHCPCPLWGRGLGEGYYCFAQKHASYACRSTWRRSSSLVIASARRHVAIQLKPAISAAAFREAQPLHGLPRRFAPRNGDGAGSCGRNGEWSGACAHNDAPPSRRRACMGAVIGAAAGSKAAGRVRLAPRMSTGVLGRSLHGDEARATHVRILCHCACAGRGSCSRRKPVPAHLRTPSIAHLNARAPIHSSQGSVAARGRRWRPCPKPPHSGRKNDPSWRQQAHHRPVCRAGSKKFQAPLDKT